MRLVSKNFMLVKLSALSAFGILWTKLISVLIPIIADIGKIIEKIMNLEVVSFKPENGTSKKDSKTWTISPTNGRRL